MIGNDNIWIHLPGVGSGKQVCWPDHRYCAGSAFSSLGPYTLNYPFSNYTTLSYLMPTLKAPLRDRQCAIDKNNEPMAPFILVSHLKPLPRLPIANRC